MTMYLYVLDDRPRMGTDLALVQGALEERLLNRSGASDVWWDEKNPYEARVYMYGSSHADTAVDDAEVDFETTDQLIWPVQETSVESEPTKPDPVFPDNVELTLTIKTDRAKESFTRTASEMEWLTREPLHLLKVFTEDAVQAFGQHWKTRTQKERTT